MEGDSPKSTPDLHVCAHRVNAPGANHIHTQKQVLCYTYFAIVIL